METKRVSIKSGKPYDVYIGRPSVFGNPWSSKPSKYTDNIVSSKKEAIEKYRQYLLNSPKLLEKIEELRGKTIACWCDEKSKCHGDVIIEILKKKRLF
jgi:hypothetical protein